VSSRSIYTFVRNAIPSIASMGYSSDDMRWSSSSNRSAGVDRRSLRSRRNAASPLGHLVREIFIANDHKLTPGMVSEIRLYLTGYKDSSRISKKSTQVSLSILCRYLWTDRWTTSGKRDSGATRIGKGTTGVISSLGSQGWQMGWVRGWGG